MLGPQSKCTVLGVGEHFIGIETPDQHYRSSYLPYDTN